MHNRFRNLAVAGVAATALVSAVPSSAEATHQIGHFLGGVVAGAVIAGALDANSGPVYAPVPVYSAPAYQCSWRFQTVCDPYTGCYRRKVQTC